MTNPIPVACHLGVFSGDEKADHEKRFERVVLGRALTTAEEEVQGFLLCYANEEDTLVELLHFASPSLVLMLHGSF